MEQREQKKVHFAPIMIGGEQNLAILEALKRLYWNITAGFSAYWYLRTLLLKGRIKIEKGAFYTSSKKVGLCPRGPLAPAALTIKDFIYLFIYL